MFLANHNKITQVSFNCLFAKYLRLYKTIKMKHFQFGSNCCSPGTITSWLISFSSFFPVFTAAVGSDCWLWRAACRYCEFVRGLLWKQNVSNTQWETYALESRFLLGTKIAKECWGRTQMFEVLNRISRKYNESRKELLCFIFRCVASLLEALYQIFQRTSSLKLGLLSR